jgi:glycosidase
LDVIQNQFSPARVCGGVRFRYFDLHASSVNIAGEFNNWDRDSYGLAKHPCGVWETVLPLKEGVYQYKYIVDGIWVHDPANPSVVLNRFKGVNSVLEIERDGSISLPAPSPGAKDFGKFRAIPGPDWLQDAIIYEIFPRAFSIEGTLDAVRKRIPELWGLGVTCIWLMPVHPIGLCGRKGVLGSPYAISSYRSIHPDLGTLDDLKELVRTAHDHGIKVIMDFVANHSAIDCDLRENHIEWYRRDSCGRPQSPGFGWTDVIGFNYKNRDLWKYMIETMCYYIKECDIDGYRCDVAALVPTDFWRDAREAIQRLKSDAILLAESHEPSHNAEAFDLTYEENLPRILQKVFSGILPAKAIRDLIEKDRLAFPVKSLRLRYLENHDQPRIMKLIGKSGQRVAASLLFTLDGVPLIHNGQEIAEQSHVSLFDPYKIHWDNGDCEIKEVYRSLIHIRRNIPALRRGSLKFLDVKGNDSVIAYYREYRNSRIMVILNFKDETAKIKISLPGELACTQAEIGYRFVDLNNGSLFFSTDKHNSSKRETVLEPYGVRILSVEAVNSCRYTA